MNTGAPRRDRVEAGRATLTRAVTAGTNLPTELSSFVGRTAELTQLLELRTTTRVLTLVGPGGIGKSRVAVQLGTAVLHAFPDGVWLVNVATLADGTVAQTVVDLLEASGQIPQFSHQSLANRLRDQQLLLILDDCERLIGECAELAGALLRACPDLEVLATSREPLGIEGEVVWRVPGLSLPTVGTTEVRQARASEAVQLFVARVRARVPGFALTPSNSRAVTSICQRLDGLPLAVELVAARVPGVGVNALATRVGAHKSLELECSRDAPARQQTLRATLDWSYALLTSTERILLRRLAVFVSSVGWTLDAAEAVCSDAALHAALVVELLDRLVGRSLVAVDHRSAPARYRLSSIVRQYALELLQAIGEEEPVRRRHAEYVLHLATRVPPARLDPAHAARLEQDRGNFRAALRWTQLGDESDLAPRLAIAGYTFWYLRGRYAEGQAWMTRWLRSPASRVQPYLRASVGCLAGHLSLLAGDLGSSHALLSEALDAQRALKNHEGIALATHFLSLRALWSGDLAEARVLCVKSQAALDYAAQDGGWRRLIESACLTTSARTAWELGEERRAGILATQAADLARARDDRFWLARALHVQALVAWRGGQHLQGLRLIERAVGLQRAHGDGDGLIDSLCGLGHFELNRGLVSEGIGAFAEAIRVAEATGARVGLVWALEGVARGLGFRQPESAARLAGACETVREALGCPMTSTQKRRFNAWLARARSELGTTNYTAARAAGRRWRQADALRFVHDLARKHWAAREETADSLTPREEEVAVLLAQGLSNKQIAAQLPVSVGTVRSHVDHILGKLGLHSRAQVAVWALHQSAKSA